MTSTPHLAMNTNILEAIASANIIVQLTLLILVTASVVSWAIILTKRKQFSASFKANQPFLDAFWKANSLDDIFESLNKFPGSNLATVFRSGFLELRKLADSNLATPSGKDGVAPVLHGIDNLERALRKAIDNEIADLDARLSWLATTGSTGPFVGLFGTVWGIMSAFHKIGATGMASLAVVAPGISEALIATGVGLFAAIPATVAYNLFVTELRREEMQLSNFASDFLNIAKRNFFRDS
jgi:biopolymer transport protein TolQ